MPTVAEALALAERDLQSGNLPRAEGLYRLILAELHNKLGIVCGQQRKLDDAVHSLRTAVRLRPDYAAAHSNLGNALRLQGRLDEAVASYRHALRYEPGLADAYNNLGLALMRQGKLDEAQACFRRALELRPGYPTAQSNLLMCLTYDPEIDPRAVFDEHRRWGAAAVRAAPAAPPAAREAERRLRVGYVSPDFCGHVVARYVLPFLAHHDPARFEIFGYAQVATPDAMTQRLQALVHHWRPTVGLTDAQAADVVRRDGIDILVDLAGHTADNRLGVFAQRPAPVQVTYLGYPNTTGLATIDYRLTDAVLDPPGEPGLATEELVRLAGPFCCYAPPEEAPEPGPPPVARDGRLTFGSTHDLAKLNPRVLDLWAAVLRAARDARLLVFRHTLSGETADYFRRQFTERGIRPEQVQLEHSFEAGLSYLALYHRVDVLLDTFPWTGHVTTCEALWMGVPVLTLRGDRHSARLSASMLTHLGLGDWVAEGPEAFVARAVRWSADSSPLTPLRAGLRERMRRSPLCDGRLFARGLEEAYGALWRRRCEGDAGRPTGS